MAFNAFESIAGDFSSTRKKLNRYSSSPEGMTPTPPPAAPPTPVAVAPPPPVRRRATRPVQAASSTQMPTDVAVALGALQQRGEQFGVDTTEFNYAAPDWGKVSAQMGEVNKVFDLMDSEMNRPPSPQPRAWEQGVGGFVGALGDNFPHLFAESNPDASFWDRSFGRGAGAVGRGLRQTVGRPARGLWRFGGEVAQDIVGSNEEAIANLARPEEEVIAGIFSDLGVTDPEQWNDFVKKEGKLKADLLLSRRILAEMGSSSWETGTQATSGFTDEENLAANQTRIKRLLELDPATGKTVAEGMMRRGQNPAEILKIGLAILEASEGVVTLGSRLALSQIGRQIDIANGGDGSKGEMWGDIIGSFAGSFPKNPAAAMRVGDSAGTVYRNADEVAAGLKATGRPVQQGSGIAAATGLDFLGMEARDVGELAKLAGTPILRGGLRAGERYAEAVGRAGTGNVLDPAPRPVSRGMAEINEELQAKIDEIDRAFKDGDLTPLQYQEMLQSVGDPTVAPKSILPEGGILGDDFGKAPEGTVVTIDGVETRLGPDGKPIVETTDDIAPPAPVAPVKAPRVTIRNVNKALADAGHNAKVHKGKDYIYFSGDDVGGWMETSVSVPRLTDDLGLDTPATVDNWVKEFERMKANPDINPVPLRDQVNEYGWLTPEAMQVRAAEREEWELIKKAENAAASKKRIAHNESVKNNPDVVAARRQLNIALNKLHKYENMPPAGGDLLSDEYKVLQEDFESRLASYEQTQRNAVAPTKEEIAQAAKEQYAIDAKTTQGGFDLTANVEGTTAAAREAGDIPVVETAKPFSLSSNQRHLLYDEAFDDFSKYQTKNMGQAASPDVAGFSESKQEFLSRMSINQTETNYGAINLPDKIVAPEHMEYLRDELLPNLARKLDDQITEGKKNPTEWVPGTQKTLKKVQAERRSIQKLIDKVGLAPVARVADDIPTSGQATLDGGVVAARTEQDIVDARTVQSGFDLTATGEDAPLRQADAAARGAGDVPSEESLLAQIEASPGLPKVIRGDFIPASPRGAVEPETGAYIYGDLAITKIRGDWKVSHIPSGQSIGPTHTYLKDAKKQVRATLALLSDSELASTAEQLERSPVVFKFLVARELVKPSYQGTSALKGIIDRGWGVKAADAAPTAPAAARQVTPPTSTDEVIINGKKYVEAPETPAEPVARAGGVIEPPSALFLPKSADEAAARLNADADDDWTYVVRHDPKNTGGSRIDILDEGGERVGPVTDEIAKGDYSFVYNDAGDRVRVDLMEGDGTFYNSANKRTRKPVDRAAIESRLTPAAPEPPVAADPKYESQHGFNDDGTLTTFESQATEGIEQFDDKLAQGEMNLPKTQAELDAAMPPSDAEMPVYFDEEQYLYDFSDGETVDNAPLFETRHPDTPLGNAERKVDELEKELDARAEYELEVEMEALRDEIKDSPLAELMEVFDGRGRPEEGLYPDQYYKIFGGGGVDLFPTGKRGNVIQRDYITWALKAHPKDFKADPMVNKVFGAEHRALSQKRNWVIDLSYTDDVPEQYRTFGEFDETYEFNAVTFLDEIDRLRSKRDRLRDYDANIEGIQLEEAAELKEAKRKELLDANDEVILQQGIVEVDYSVGNNREIAERTINNLRGPYSPEEVAALPDFQLARLVAENISTQNPGRGTSGSIYAKGLNPRAVDPVVGTGDPVKLGPPDNLQQTQGGIRPDITPQPSETYVKISGEVNEAAREKQRLAAAQKTLKPITGSVDEVEQGLEYPVPGSTATQSSQAEVARATRITPTKGLPYKINSPAEAENARGAMYMPLPDSKSQVAASNLRGTIEAGMSRDAAQTAYLNAMPGEEIIPPKQMLKDIAEENLNDIGSITAHRLDPGRIANTVDRGQAIGSTTNTIIETTQRTDDAGRMWLDTGIRDWTRLLNKYRIKSNADKKRLTNIVEKLSFADVYREYDRAKLIDETNLDEIVAAQDLLNKPPIAKAVQGLSYNDKIRFIQAAQDTRTFLDNLRIFQNQVRTKRKQKLIPWLDAYVPHIRKMTAWSKLGGFNYDQSDIAGRSIPDFTLPGTAFNQHELARKYGLPDESRELNADKLIRSYLTTAMKDVFHTEIDRNIKATTKLWRKAKKDNYSLDNAADAFDNYSAEAYLGVPSLGTKALRAIPIWNSRLNIGKGRALPSLMDATVMAKTGLTRTVFPFNWTWNTFIQTSSGLLTPVRYGVRNSLKALDAITSSSVRNDIDTFAYVARTKGRRGNSVVMQNTGDDVYAFNENIPWQDRWLEWASFLSTQIEKHLTRHAIRAAYLRGEKLGYEGAELWQFASQGGARTQSMYNKADTVGALRSREVSAMIPFQTFAFEMFNTLAELNVPILRSFTGKLGAYETFGANTARGKATTYGRLKNLAIWLAGAVAINAIADRASNRKPWNVSSFVPGWALLSGGVNGLGPGSAFLPQKIQYDVTSAVKAYINHGDKRELGSVGLRYLGLPGGTQIDKTWAGIEAVQDGVVRNKDRTTKFEVQAPEMKGIAFDIPFIGETNITDAKINPEEFLKTYGQGIWSTNGGQEYLDQQLGRNTEGQSTSGKIKADIAESFGLDRFPIDRGGKQGSLNRKFKKAKDAYYKIPTDEDARKERGLPTRTEFRRNNPEIDAQLFVAGQFSTLQSSKAKEIAKELIVEHDLLNQGGGFFTGRGVDKEQEEIFRNVFGDRWVDSIIGGVGNAPMRSLPSTQPKREGYVPISPVTTPVEPQSAAPKTASENWRLVSNYLTRDNLVALQKIWDGKEISRTESTSLKTVFEKVPLGQTNFRKWSKQTLRQLQENAVVRQRVRNPREAVTV